MTVGPEKGLVIAVFRVVAKEEPGVGELGELKSLGMGLGVQEMIQFKIANNCILSKSILHTCT